MPRHFMAIYWGLNALWTLVGWIVTFSSTEPASSQISIASEGGSGSQVPDISIEVEDVDEIYRKAKSAGSMILYDIVNEPWGVQRFYVLDPFEKVVNIQSHIE